MSSEDRVMPEGLWSGRLGPSLATLWNHCISPEMIIRTVYVRKENPMYLGICQLAFLVILSFLMTAAFLFGNFFLLSLEGTTQPHSEQNTQVLSRTRSAPRWLDFLTIGYWLKKKKGKTSRRHKIRKVQQNSEWRISHILPVLHSPSLCPRGSHHC
jgi:hypothetical protein